ncbi:aminotransferase class III-fold pyridoxal phosphate-dependent enzyme [Saccharopolyspora hirsuta]|uniref:Aminotransferase class III-fold pyridoxal phosphate-dependent enzyme n=1 Tax=Saccharopolyspora hirsuta TaxID=1837 RepID=A0A5M7C5T0_SACHI|nr:aminotransferase class III-fold pyridoxal phosphate-dependent enzyme [Saccharopolyspora hirsuta]KAA5834954.1 aminotransferase class III-fold pyridoxal phosphate-dependent enzyme [Saccharopolyspora hirsuta]
MTSEVKELVDGVLHRATAEVGLDVEYVRARGNTVFARGRDGTGVPVADFLGGYGALLLGHNHPDLVAHLANLLAQETPVLVQLSSQPAADEVVRTLNRVLHREFDVDEPYFGVFANSGAEGIEVALKHAEFDRGQRVDAMRAEIDENIGAALSAGLAGATVDGSVLGLPVGSAVDEVVEEIRVRNAAAFATGPRLIALSGGFHGKLVGSGQLTHNHDYRSPFASLAAQATFAPANEPEALRAVFEDARVTAYDLRITETRAEVVRRDAPVFCALLVEPVQGEGGIVPLTAEFAKQVQELGAEFGCPVVVDEIQSGTGRTGTFFASAQLGLLGDYYVLSKSIGGGLAKLSVTLVRAARYRPEFEMVHSSTFAKDGLSTSVAAAVLELLEAGDGALYRVAAERGRRLSAALHEVRAEYPEIITDVRGLGLLQGVEFGDLSTSGSTLAAQLQAQGQFGFLASGFLLHEHRIRLFPTGSAPNTLRLEPSVQVTDEEIDRLATGLRALCALLRAGDDQGLTAFIAKREF